jgi:hypothetical protein
MLVLRASLQGEACECKCRRQNICSVTCIQFSPWQGQPFLPSSTASRPALGPMWWLLRTSHRGQDDQGVNLTTHFHVVPTPRIQAGRSPVQVVSHSLPAEAARVQAQVRSCRICGRQRGTGGRFSPSTPISPANHSTDSSTLIIIHHPRLVQYAKWCPTYQVDSVLLHPPQAQYRHSSLRL